MNLASVIVFEEKRLKELSQYNILDTEPEEAFDGIVTLASKICRAPVALVSLIDKERQWSKAHFGFEMQQTDRRIAFCSHAILQNDPFIIRDIIKDPRFVDNPLVKSKPFFRFYAGIPLVTSAGNALGTLCVLDYKPRVLSVFHLESLKILAQQIMSLLVLRRQLTEQANELLRLKKC